MNRSNKPEAHT